MKYIPESGNQTVVHNEFAQPANTQTSERQIKD